MSVFYFKKIDKVLFRVKSGIERGTIPHQNLDQMESASRLELVQKRAHIFQHAEFMSSYRFTCWRPENKISKGRKFKVAGTKQVKDLGTSQN